MDMASGADVLKYGALGLAFACIVVFGITVRSMIDMPADRAAAARTVLLASLAAFLVFGIGSLGLAYFDLRGNQARVAQIVVDPWIEANDAELQSVDRPTIRVCNASYQGNRIIKVRCPPGADTDVSIDFTPYIKYALRNAIQTRQTLVKPQVDDSGI